MLTSCYPAVYPLKLALPSKKYAHFFISLLFGLTFSFPANAQLRQVYLDTQANNQVMKISFFSPSTGYIGFYNWVGFTTDSGRTYARKYITLSNVNVGSYSNIDVTGGFDIRGVKAFSQDTIIVYGDYALVPSILYSTNGGNTFTLVFYSQFNPNQLSTGIMDMAFPVDHRTGFAVDADRILKTSNGGVTWTVVDVAQGSFFNYLEALDNNNLFAFSNSNSPGTVLRTSDGGSTWQTPVLPAGQINYITFYTAGKLWVSMQNGSASNLYYSADAGADWTPKNPAAAPFSCIKMKFVNDSTGYALKAGFTVYKTSDSGKLGGTGYHGLLRPFPYDRPTGNPGKCPLHICLAFESRRLPVYGRSGIHNSDCRHHLHRGRHRFRRLYHGRQHHGKGRRTCPHGNRRSQPIYLLWRFGTDRKQPHRDRYL
jgi:hypothetical protein